MAIAYMSEGPTVERLQRALVQCGLTPGRIDGIAGKRTFTAVRAFCMRHGLPAPAMKGIVKQTLARVIEMIGALHAGQRPETPRPKIRAWCTASALRNQQARIVWARLHGLSGLDLMINGWGLPRKRFSISKVRRQRAIDFSKRCRDATIELHLTSWITPHKGFIDEAADVLLPLLDDGEFKSLHWDTEGPYFKSTRSQGFDAAPQQVAERFAPRPCPMGMTSFASVSKDGKASKLAAVCDYTCPQVYLLHVPTAPAKYHDKYARQFGKPVVIGLAGYRQKRTPASQLYRAMQANWASACTTDAKEVAYWSLGWLRKMKGAQRFLRELTV